MMNVVIFKDLTTNEYLNELDKEAEKYNGLYVEMDNKDERKYVKDKASLIDGLRKKIDRARIDKTKDFRLSVEEEAKRIDERLVDANKPFALLIDEHKEKRARILAEEKEARDAEELRIQIELDHNDAITLDKMRDFEIKEAEEKRIQYEADIAERAATEANERAKQAEADKIAAQEKAKADKVASDKAIANQKKMAEEREAQAKIDADNAVIAAQEKAKQDAENAQIAKEAKEAADLEAREKNKKHIGKIRGDAKNCLMKFVNENVAKKIVLAINSGEISYVTINY